MSLAIYYEPEGYSTTGQALMGRQAAGESFLKGLIRNTTYKEITAFSNKSEHFKQFCLFHSDPSIAPKLTNLNFKEFAGLKKYGTLYYPGPGLGELGHIRSLIDNASWSLCGITHTTSSSAAMDSISNLLTAPVYPWDALICTSESVKQNVEVIIQAEASRLKSRLGVKDFILPQLPVIPLGLNTEEFLINDIDRLNAKRILNVNEEIVVLYLGRLSFHAKAHPFPMYVALEQASKATGKKLCLVECGWFASDYIKDSFTEANEFLCPNVRVLRVDGRVPDNRARALAAADIACSLSDNIQETFGIVPIEAMAAGLPVIVSDWNGYRETVRHNVDGYRVKTLAPEPGYGGDLSTRYALGIDNYDNYIGFCSSLVAIDIAQLQSSFEALINSETLRKKFGESGQKRARECYDWKTIVPRYEALWEALSELRSDYRDIAASKISNKSKIGYQWPARIDPTIAFSHYPTYHLKYSSKISISNQLTSYDNSKIQNILNLRMVKFSVTIIPSEEEIFRVLRYLKKRRFEEVTVSDVVSIFEPLRAPYIYRSLCWMCKIGFIEADLQTDQ